MMAVFYETNFLYRYCFVSTNNAIPSASHSGSSSVQNENVSAENPA